MSRRFPEPPCVYLLILWACLLRLLLNLPKALHCPNPNLFWFEWLNSMNPPLLPFPLFLWSRSPPKAGHLKRHVSWCELRTLLDSPSSDWHGCLGGVGWEMNGRNTPCIRTPRAQVLPDGVEWNVDGNEHCALRHNANTLHSALGWSCVRMTDDPAEPGWM